ncbi:MAG: phosphatidate cytidylyltransferase [Anaerolineae bacterium]|nr:phosphatidate cytidylyltransferase [Anaerolineae bacterium]
MRTRIISAVVLIPLVIGAILIGGWVFWGLVLIATSMAGFEYARMLRHNGYMVLLPLLWSLIILWLGDIWWGYGDWLSPGVCCIVLLSAGWQVVAHERHPEQAHPTANWALTLAGGLYLGIGGAYLVLLRNLPEGLWWTLTALPVVWIADSGAYFIGRQWGKHKMAPTLSPGKTWEGYVGEVISGVIAGLLLGWLWPEVAGVPLSLTPWWGGLLGFLLAVFTPLGDLFVSMIKRDVGVKDSGNLIPGHGGLFDRIDSLIWAGALTWAFAMFLT